MPRYKSSERDENGGIVYKDVCNPITAEFREELYGNILEAFEQEKSADKSQAGNARGEAEIDKPEQVTDIRDAIAPVSSVAEPSEYQFGAEAFEAAYPKMDSGIKPDEKAPSVPKTGKER